MNEDGTYSFKQPASNVTVEVLYEALTPEEEMQRELMKDDIKVADSNEVNSMSDCWSCLLNNDKSCKDTMYYKTNVSGIDMCTTLSTGETKTCDAK